jgi:hypothetical protein
MPFVASKSILGFWGQNPTNHPPMILRLKPPNLVGIAYALCSLHDLDACHMSTLVLDCLITKSLCLCLTWLSRSTPPSHVHLLVDVCKCQPPMASLLALGPSVQGSCPSFTTPVHRHEPAKSPSLVLANWWNLGRLTFYSKCDYELVWFTLKVELDGTHGDWGG